MEKLREWEQKARKIVGEARVRAERAVEEARARVAERERSLERENGGVTREEYVDGKHDAWAEERAEAEKVAEEDSAKRWEELEANEEQIKRWREDVEEERRVPQTEIEFVEMIKRMPESALAQRDRERIAAVMSFDDKMVRDLMVPRRKMIFVQEDEVLGPLVLDKLYKSGLTSFPVVNGEDEVLGIIHTEALNALEIREADKAAAYLDKKVGYLRVNNSLRELVDKVEQTGETYYLVRAENGLVVGFITVGMVLDYLVGK